MKPAKLLIKTLDLLLPPLCLSCDVPVGENRTLCPKCWSGIHFIAKPVCTCCGAPFDIPVEEGALCGSCISDPPHFIRARAAMLYDDNSKSLVLGLKHGDRTYLARGMASWMHRAAGEFWGEIDIIAPVPLHRIRLFKRRYNQAALLGAYLAKLEPKLLLPDLLLRTRSTPPQGRMNRKDRRQNVKSAFAVSKSHIATLKDKTVLLIDDVLTTGATLNECSRILLETGAKAVNVLTLSRTKGYL